MSRRRGSATALNASEVVEARAMGQQYIPIWEYVKRFFQGSRFCQRDPRVQRSTRRKPQRLVGARRRRCHNLRRSRRRAPRESRHPKFGAASLSYAAACRRSSAPAARPRPSTPSRPRLWRVPHRSAHCGTRPASASAPTNPRPSNSRRSHRRREYGNARRFARGRFLDGRRGRRLLVLPSQNGKPV